MSETTQERLVRYLQDAHAAEVGVEELINSFVNDDEYPDIRAFFERHQMDVRSQTQRIETRLAEMGHKPNDGKGFLNSLMAKASDFVNAAHDDFDRTTQNLIKAYSTCHLKRGMYESLAAYSRTIGDLHTAELAISLQKEAENAAQEIFPFISSYAQTAVLGTETVQARAYQA